MYKQQEFNYNKAIIIRFFSRDNNTKKEYALIASGIQINELSLTQYLTQAASKNTPEADKINDVKNAIVIVIGNILKDYVYAK